MTPESSKWAPLLPVLCIGLVLLFFSKYEKHEVPPNPRREAPFTTIYKGELIPYHQLVLNLILFFRQDSFGKYQIAEATFGKHLGADVERG